MIYAGDTTPTNAPTDTPDTVRDGDGAPASVKKPKNARPAPVCMVSGEALDTERMLRFVVGPDDTLYPDFTGKLPGREFWCNLYRPTLNQAFDGGLFGDDIVIPASIAAQIESGLRHQALSLVSMARKAGKLVTGAEKTETVIKSGRAATYLTASEKEADTRMKLTFLCGNQTRIVDLFSSDELSGASGVNKVYHAALLRSGVAEQFFVHVKRLNLFMKQ